MAKQQASKRSRSARKAAKFSGVHGTTGHRTHVGEWRAGKNYQPRPTNIKGFKATYE